MLSKSMVERLEARPVWLIATAWLIACVVMTMVSRTWLQTGVFPDPDDTVRLLEVRDWLGGQSWFDVTQYRINPPDGAPMHWSRLVDVPIASVILLFRPLVGQANAELAALVLVPLISLGIVMSLVFRLGDRLMNRRLALLAMAATPFSLGAVSQLIPMRIDHHGWQIVLVLVAVLAAIDERPRRSALAAGLAAALWLNISMEGLPFAVALGALFGLRWLVDAAEAERLRTYACTLAGGSLLLVLLTRLPSTWGSTACDAVSSVHLAAFSVAALGCFAGVRTEVKPLWMRLAVLGVCGGLALAAMLLTNGECVRDPFAALDPLVRRFWYEHVLEGLPIWRQGALAAVSYVALPLVGMAGAWLARQGSEGRIRIAWENYLFLLAAATLASALVVRAGVEANTIALPGAAILCERAIRRARALRITLLRVVATTAAVFTVMPASAIAIVAGWTASAPPKSFAQSSARCLSGPRLTPLNRLPTGDIASPMDMGPSILVYSHHRVIASGHHRNSGGMRDVILLFTRTTAEAPSILVRRDIEYVVVCPGLAEPHDYEVFSPHGFMSDLMAERLPAWLEPVKLDGAETIRVWRVRKDLLGAPRRRDGPRSG